MKHEEILWKLGMDKSRSENESKLVDGIVYFLLRVEEGSIRSRTTYNYYKTIIEDVLNEEWEDVRERL